MKTIKKAVKYVLLFGSISVVIFLVAFIIFAHIFGLKKIDAFFPNTHYPISYFKKSALQNITIESVYKNGFDDSVYIFHYSDSFKIALWIIKQKNNVCFTNSIDIKQTRLIPADYFPYERLSLNTLFLQRKEFNRNLKNVSIYFGNCTDIQNIINTKVCQSFHLKVGAIYLTADSNNRYDFYLGLNNSMYSDFMAFTMNSKLYLLALYTTNKSDINPDELSNIVNFPLK